ncbi:MAG: aminotransferase class I/II-fold pyridoxal phosphate-dependent enzyme, partial [bacterium]|nr:aminotransferase class I/II-fold pyridoxal phosphate-dependent enzyme [bacterium]
MPLLETLLRHVKNNVTSFHCPGHKNGRALDRRIKKLGKKVFSIDVTVFKEVDSLHDPIGPIKYAQRLMAKAYGVKESLFLVNGTSVGNIAMLLGSLEQGDSVIISRIAHKSALSGIILSGLWPIWMDPIIEKEFMIMLDAQPTDIKQMLKRFPEVKAVFVTSPTYNGVVTDLVGIADVTHSVGKLLLVDEAHGPHLKFNKSLPVSAVETGADVCVQSIHKILSALSQGSVLHIISDRVDINKMN